VRRLRPVCSDDIILRPDEVVFPARESRLKSERSTVLDHDQQWSSVMLSQLFSLIYRLSCRTTLLEIGTHRLAR